MKNSSPALAAVALLLGAIASQCSTSSAHGNAHRQTYAWALTAVAINEAGIYRISLDDLALVHQAASHHSSTTGGRLAWLQRHSRRVLGDRHCRVGAPCSWTRPLWRTGELGALAGRGFPRVVRWAHANAEALADGELDLNPCPVDVVSWGKLDDRDFVNGRRIPVRCGKARNAGATTIQIIAEAARRAGDGAGSPVAARPSSSRSRGPRARAR